MSERICSIPDCDRPHYGRGWCELHYDRWRRHGDPMIAGVIRGDDQARFWSKVDVSQDCWIWTGPIRKKRDGYGQFYSKGKNWPAHRWLWTQTNGPIPDGLELRHTCDRPACVRPDHLVPGTHRDNMDDRIERKTGGRGFGHGMVVTTNVGRLTIDDCRDIQELHRSGLSQTAIAKRFTVSQGTISRIVRGVHWIQKHPS